MKHTDGKIKVIETKDNEVIMRTESGFEFPVPLNAVIGMGYKAKDYRDFIVRELQRRNVYFMPLD